ncbi:hypothetical protein OIV83_000453 [Microbotryomycetes sp. JL201]|nr:hypothetical protein OIV83_000453 [Microbotryomycetes sp. JL201]
MLLDGEFEWDLDDENDITAWEKALEDASEHCGGLIAPSFSLKLADQVSIHCHASKETAPILTLHAASLSREDQVRLNTALTKQLEVAATEEHPTLSVYVFMQEYLATNPPASPKPPSVAESNEARQALDPKTKVVLFWSHHLLATGKRKNIVQWSSELGLWGISKPGYPGVWVVEGLVPDVDEFTHRIKQLNWKALQVRCELESPAFEAPPGKEQMRWILEHKTYLASVLASSFENKIGVIEVERLDELGSLMKKAGLADVFKTALKL